MSKSIRHVVAAIGAVLVMAVTVGAASASEATVAPGGRLLAVDVGSITFGEGATAIECLITLSIELRFSISLAVGRTFGSVTAVRIAFETCNGGEVSSILGLPWPLTVRAILGRAPNELTGFDFFINGAAFELEGFAGVTCLYSGNAVGLMAATRTARAGVYTTGIVTAVSSVRIPKRAGIFLCPETGSFRGSFTISPTQSITVT